MLDFNFRHFLKKYIWNVNKNFILLAKCKQTTGLGHITISDLKKIQVTIPKIKKQEKVAKKLKTFDKKIEINKKINQTLENLAKEIYRADDVIADKKILDQLAQFEEAGYAKFPICIAKTQYSFSTDPNNKGAPLNHSIPIREVRLSSGAEFIVVICGEIMTMPGLPSVPAADSIRLNDQGEIEGLF